MVTAFENRKEDENGKTFPFACRDIRIKTGLPRQYRRGIRDGKVPRRNDRFFIGSTSGNASEVRKRVQRPEANPTSGNKSEVRKRVRSPEARVSDT